MISVIIPTYNRGRCIQRSIDSVLSQTYKDIELIIVDDGSTDQTEEVVKKYEDPRIRYIKAGHGGAGAARNRGVFEAKGEYIAFQDSDDYWQPQKLERQLERMKNVDADILFCAFERGLEGEIKRERVPVGIDGESRFIDVCDLLPGNMCSTQTLLLKKECFVKDQ